MSRHPAWVIAARLTALGLTRAERLMFAPWLLKRDTVSSFKDLEPDEITHLNDLSETRSDAWWQERIAVWRSSVRHEAMEAVAEQHRRQYSLEELIALKDEFLEGHPDAPEDAFEIWLDLREAEKTVPNGVSALVTTPHLGSPVNPGDLENTDWNGLEVIDLEVTA